MGEVTSSVFRGGSLIRHGNMDTAEPPTERESFIWIEVIDPSDLDFSSLQGLYGLHDLAVQDSMTPYQGPKLNRYDDQIFIILKLAELHDDEIQYSELDAFLSGHHIITVRHGASPDHDRAREMVEKGPASSRLGPDFVLHTIVDFVVQGYFPLLQMIQDEVLSMQQQLLDGFLDRAEINRLFGLRKEAIHFQHILARMSDVCGKLTNLDVPCIGPDVRPYFRDVHDNLVRLDLMITSLIDIIRAVFDASNLLEQQRQGLITRQLAAWAGILAVPTAIAAVFGMSPPDEIGLDFPYTLPIIIGVMVLVSAALFFRFKSLRWL